MTNSSILVPNKTNLAIFEQMQCNFTKSSKFSNTYDRKQGSSDADAFDASAFGKVRSTPASRWSPLRPRTAAAGRPARSTPYVRRTLSRCTSSLCSARSNPRGASSRRSSPLVSSQPAVCSRRNRSGEGGNSTLCQLL